MTSIAYGSVQCDRRIEIDMNPVVKLLSDLGPLAVFFTVFKFSDIYVATAALMVATTISIAVTYSLTKTVPLMPLVTGALVLIFGGLTIWLNSEFFIKVKLTLIEVLMGSGLLIGLAMGRPLAKDVMGAAFELPDFGLANTNLALRRHVLLHCRAQ